MEKIIIRGAKTHNLKNVNAELPRNQLVVITGPSGSGKSSLAFDTLYAEGQRRYLEGLSPYARQFLNIRNKPDVDSIEGLSPAIAIDQKNRSDNSRLPAASLLPGRNALLPRPPPAAGSDTGVRHCGTASCLA